MSEVHEHLLLSVYRHLREKVEPRELAGYVEEQNAEIEAMLDGADERADSAESDVSALTDSIIDEARRGNRMARGLVAKSQTWGELDAEWFAALVARRKR